MSIEKEFANEIICGNNFTIESEKVEYIQHNLFKGVYLKHLVN